MVAHLAPVPAERRPNPLLAGSADRAAIAPREEQLRAGPASAPTAPALLASLLGPGPGQLLPSPLSSPGAFSECTLAYSETNGATSEHGMPSPGILSDWTLASPSASPALLSHCSSERLPVDQGLSQSTTTSSLSAASASYCSASSVRSQSFSYLSGSEISACSSAQAEEVAALHSQIEAELDALIAFRRTDGNHEQTIEMCNRLREEFNSLKAAVVDAAPLTGSAPKDRRANLGQTTGASKISAGTPRGARPGSRSSTGSQPTTPRMVPNRAAGSLSAGRTRSDAIGFGSSTGRSQHTPSRSNVMSMTRAPGLCGDVPERKSAEARRPKQSAHESPTQGSFRTLRAPERTSPQSSPKASPKTSPKTSPRTSPRSSPKTSPRSSPQRRADGPDGKIVRPNSPPRGATSPTPATRRSSDGRPARSSSPPEGVRKAPESKPAGTTGQQRSTGSSPTPAMRKNNESKLSRSTGPVGSPTPAARKSPSSRSVRPTSPAEAKTVRSGSGKQRSDGEFLDPRGDGVRRSTTPSRVEGTVGTPRRVRSPNPDSSGHSSGSVRHPGSPDASSPNASPSGSSTLSVFSYEASASTFVASSVSSSELPLAGASITPHQHYRNISSPAFRQASLGSLPVEHPASVRPQPRRMGDVLTSAAPTAESLGYLSPRPPPKGASITVQALLPPGDPTGYLSPRPPPRGGSLSVLPGTGPAPEVVGGWAPARLASVPLSNGPIIQRESLGFSQQASGAPVPTASSMWAGAHIVHAPVSGSGSHGWQATAGVPSGSPIASPPVQVPSFAFAGPGQFRAAPPPMTLSHTAHRPATGAMPQAAWSTGTPVNGGSMRLPPGVATA